MDLHLQRKYFKDTFREIPCIKREVKTTKVGDFLHVVGGAALGAVGKRRQWGIVPAQLPDGCWVMERNSTSKINETYQ